MKPVSQPGSTENAQLILLREQHVFTVHSSRLEPIDIRYDKVVRLSSWRGEQSQTGKRIAAGAVTYGIGVLLVNKAQVYHLWIDYQAQAAVRRVELLLDKSDWGEVLQVARTETGKEVAITTSGAPAPPSGPAALTITSSPSAADIQVNGAFAGSTPEWSQRGYRTRGIACADLAVPLLKACGRVCSRRNRARN